MCVVILGAIAIIVSLVGVVRAAVCGGNNIIIRFERVFDSHVNIIIFRVIAAVVALIRIITAVIAAVILYKTLPQTALYKRMIPFTPQKSGEGFTISRGYETLIGEKGETITDLRPVGKVSIQGKTYQAFSHGDYIDKDEEILVDSIDENQLLVKKV